MENEGEWVAAVFLLRIFVTKTALRMPQAGWLEQGNLFSCSSGIYETNIKVLTGEASLGDLADADLCSEIISLHVHWFAALLFPKDISRIRLETTSQT